MVWADYQSIDVYYVACNFVVFRRLIRKRLVTIRATEYRRLTVENHKLDVIRTFCRNQLQTLFEQKKKTLSEQAQSCV